jgi:hypothetical protein
MSAYHHVKDGTAYPAVMLTTGINDPRVDACPPAVEPVDGPVDGPAAEGAVEAAPDAFGEAVTDPLGGPIGDQNASFDPGQYSVDAANPVAADGAFDPGASLLAPEAPSPESGAGLPMSLAIAAEEAATVDVEAPQEPESFDYQAFLEEQPAEEAAPEAAAQQDAKRRHDLSFT